MNFTTIETFCIALETSTSALDNVAYWRIKTIDFDGACLNSQDFDKTYVIDTWKTERKPGNVTAEQFIEVVNNLIPFTNKSYQKHFDEKFVAFIDSNPNIADTYNFKEFRKYMQRLTRRYNHRGDVEVVPKPFKSSTIENEKNKDTQAITNIITQQPDHVVFMTSTIFQSIKNNEHYELWDFQVEAVLSSENQWKIIKIFLRPPLHYIGNNKMFTDLLTDHVKDIRVRTEISMKNGTFPIFHRVSIVKNILNCSDFGDNLTYDNFSKVYRERVESHVLEAEQCGQHIFEPLSTTDFLIICFFKKENELMLLELIIGQFMIIKKKNSM